MPLNKPYINSYVKTGQIFFGICLAGMGLLQFIFPGFLPVIIPEWPQWIPGYQFWVYLTGAGLVFAGLCIAAGWKGRNVSLITAAMLFLIFLVFHLPFRLNHDPQILGAWTNELKILGFAGSALIAAASFPQTAAGPRPLFRFLEKFIPAGRYFLCLMLIVFGIDHILYLEFVTPLVPAWIPGAVFWTYVSAALLIGSGLAILLQIQTRRVAFLLAIVLFIWFAILHIPRAIAYPDMDNGNEITSVFQSLGFSGIALLIAAGSIKREK